MPSDYLDYENNLAFPPHNATQDEMQRKLNDARTGILNAAKYLTCPDDLSNVNNGKCNEQMALEMLNATLEKIK